MNIDVKDVHISLLRKLLSEMEEKNNILKENCNLWKEKYDSANSKSVILNSSQHSKHSFSPPSPGNISNKKVIKKSKQTLDVAENTKNCENDLRILNPENPSSSNHEIASSSNAPASDIDVNNKSEAKKFQNQQQQKQTDIGINESNIEQNEQSDPNIVPNNHWENQKRRGFRRKNDPQIKQGSSRPEPVRGTNENVNVLKVATRMAFLFLSGFAPDVKGEQVLEYLKSNKMGNNCDCNKIQTKRDKYRSAFRLAVPYSERENYLIPTLWPQGISVNHFLNIQRQTMARTYRQQT